MDATITLPVWLFVVIVALAVLAAVDDVFIPGLRWYLRRRINRAIDDANARFGLELPTFQLTTRRVLIDRLVFDPEVMETVAETAAKRGEERERLMAEVSQIAREMVPAFNAYFYFGLGYWGARRLLRAFYRVRLGFAHERAAARAPPDTAVVFFINHRSNVDYLLVTYLAARSVALSYGAGEWARIWPLRGLLRLAGVYILRRDSGDPLYRKALERYVQMATEACVPHAVFAEGKLSRDGAIGRPKLGMLGYITKTFDPAGAYDVEFVPVATNFDRVMEERTLVANPDADFKGRGGGFVVGSTLRFVARITWQKLRGRFPGFGVACANFGEPVSLREWSNARGLNFSTLDKRALFAAVEELGEELTRRIVDVVPVLAVPLVSTVLVEADGPLDRKAVGRRALQWLDEARALGAHVALKEGREAVEIEKAVRSLRKRGLIAERGGGLVPEEGQRPLLAYYAGSIQQLRAHLERKRAGSA